MKNGKIFGLTGLLLLSVALGATYYFYWPIHSGKLKVLAQLNDPDSAKFRNVNYHRPTGGICGEVNARNQMGGYVGFKMFLIEKDGAAEIFHESGEDSSNTEVKLKFLTANLAFLEKMVKVCPEQVSTV